MVPSQMTNRSSSSSSTSDSMHKSIPYLRKTETAQQLVVRGQPFLILGAELQNSSMTSAEYMKPHWSQLADDNINTVLGCVTWEQIEPTEGRFDFSQLDQVVLDARASGLHLILLWFGSWKNGVSTYVPAWVKKDNKRFPRVMLRKDRGLVETSETLSMFDTAALDADAKAFKTLMAHVAEIDGDHSTVIMVQVENEVGVVGDSRDASPAANKAFARPVPKELTDKLDGQWDSLNEDLQNHLSHYRTLKTSVEHRSWAQVFGESLYTDEIFMAYHYACYVERVASAGKSAYPVPLYVNVWQNYSAGNRDRSAPVVAGGGSNPGDYPSGGGITNVLDIWQLFAPNIDFIAPDIYLNDYSSSCANYRHRNQTLFVPEQRRDAYGARRVWEAIGTHLAIGCSPFGIDTVRIEHGGNPYAKHYGLLQSVSKLVLDAQCTHGTSYGFFFDDIATTDGWDPAEPKSIVFGGWELSIERSFVFGKPSAGSGMILWLGDARFLLIGWGFRVTWTSTSPKAHFTGILRFDEREVVDVATGELRTLRMLNGDETRGGRFTNMPIEDPDYGNFPISVTIPARTGIAEVEVYALED